MKLLSSFLSICIYISNFVRRSISSRSRRLNTILNSFPCGIPNDVLRLRESIVHSPNEQSDRFLYLGANHIADAMFAESSSLVELLTHYQLPLAPFCSLPVSQSLFASRKNIRKTCIGGRHHSPHSHNEP